MHQFNKNNLCRGFSLFETAIFLVIASILISTFTSQLFSSMKSAKISSTQNRLDTINDTLRTYVVNNGALPCPASLTDAPDTATFGVSAAVANCAGASAGTFETTLNSTAARPVRIGAVPTRSLGLPDEYIGDAWGDRFVYAVTEVLTDPATYSPSMGSINIEDGAGHAVALPAGSTKYVIISLGPDKAGAYTLQGTNSIPCPGGQKQSENCDYANAMFHSTMMVSSAAGANFFDDYVIYNNKDTSSAPIPSGAVMAFNLATCPTGWTAYANATGRAIIGTGNYFETYTPDVRSWSFSQNYLLNDTGGAASWQLDINEMPSHDHGILMRPSVFDALSTAGPTDNVAVSPAGPSAPVNTQATGGGQPHENRMPFIALTYCEKN